MIKDDHFNVILGACLAVVIAWYYAAVGGDLIQTVLVVGSVTAVVSGVALISTTLEPSDENKALAK